MEEGCTPAGKIKYKNIFYSELNLSFHILGNDRCDFCNSSEEETADRRKEYDQHVTDKDAARQRRDEHKDKAMTGETFTACCFDLEHILTTQQSNENNL